MKKLIIKKVGEVALFDGEDYLPAMKRGAELICENKKYTVISVVKEKDLRIVLIK